MTATEDMGLALLDITDHGQSPPCSYSSDEWLSEDLVEKRVTACHRCHDCELIALCGRYVKEIHASFGVWRGRDFTPRPRKVRTR